METIHPVFMIGDALYVAQGRPYPTDLAHFLPINQYALSWTKNHLIQIIPETSHQLELDMDIH